MKTSELQIISGGQTGADRAALEAARRLGIPSGGWCPKGRLAEDGAIPQVYPLDETPSEDYAERTEWNVRDSDATLILTLGGEIKGGTLYTRQLADSMAKPSLVVDCRETAVAVAVIRRFLDSVQPQKLNIAGPRESQAPGIQGRALEILLLVLGNDQGASSASASSGAES